MRVLNVLLVFLVLMLMPGVLFAGVTGKIAGVVKDKDTGDPLPGVNIVIEGTAMGAASDLNGEYFIINIPPGTYTVTASMVGYNSLTQRAVRVSVDLTTPLNFALEPTVIEFEAVTVTAERPMIQKDMTASTQVYSAEDIENVALDEVQETVTLTAGAVVAGGDMHIRGGREREVVYMIDGMQVEDPSFGGFDTDVPELSVGEISVVTGGFDAEYGSAQSGLVNLITKEGGAKFSGKLRYKTTLWDANSNYHFPNDPSPGGWYLWGVRMGDGEQLKDYEFSIGGPEPISTYLLPEIPGEVNFFFSGEVMSDRGRFPHQHSQPHTFQGKLTYEPSPNYKISLGGLVNWDDYEIFSNRWRRTTYEDLNDRYRNPDDPYYIQGWYGNGRLDTEDLNGNNVLDEGEDLNGNGVLDSEDLNYNGWIYDPQTNTRTWNPDALDAFSMLDHLPYYEDDTNNWNLSWTHTLSSATFYEVKFSRYMTKSLWQTRERMNEDRDGDGRLDAGEDLNHNGILDPGEDVDGDGALDLDEDLNNDGIFWPWIEDIDGDGFFDNFNEDLNGNYRLDAYNEDTDLLRDEDRDGYIDASEELDENGNGYIDASEERWPDDPQKWVRVWDWDYALAQSSTGTQDTDKFYTYGPGGYTYSRHNWRQHEQYQYQGRFDITSQWGPHHQIKAGLEGSYYDLMYYRSPDRYGYTWNYRVFPSKGAAYIQDKMEYEGMVLKAGLRFDYFNPNKESPRDITDPVWDATDLDDESTPDINEAWVDEDGDDIHDIYGKREGAVKFPKEAKLKTYWSPRLGVSFPITERDLLFFNYGRFFQMPLLYNTFININYSLTGGYPVVGNPDLEPERTTTYEIGVKHQFTDTILLRATGFYKDITGLVDTRSVFWTVSDWYAYYYNTDYGSVRGFELSWEKRYSHYTSGVFNYTYSIAKGKASEISSGYITEWGGNIIPRVESYLDWDQRHTISANLNITIPEGENLFGSPIFDDTNLSIIFAYGSGTRWTMPRGTRLDPVNTETMPATSNTDLRLTKRFRWGRYRPAIFLEVLNLFNRRNVVRIADTEWYAADYDGDGNPDHDPEGRWDDPTVYGPRRIVRVGVSFEY